MISEHAVIDPSAKIGQNVSIGPFSVIGPEVEIGDNTIIESHVVIKGYTKIGQHNHIFQFSSIGEITQDLSYHGEQTYLEIGDHNTIREFVTINRGTAKEDGFTRIGHHNLLMAYVHIAHDCQIGNHVVLVNMTTLAGHVHVGDHAILGGGTLVHQFVHIGEYAFTGGGSGIMQDVLPHTLVKGNPASPRSLNLVGLRRASFTAEELATLKKAYKLLYRQGLPLEQAKQEIAALAANCQPLNAWLAFLQNSQRGLARPD